MSILKILPKISKGLIIAIILFMLSCFVTTIIYTGFSSFRRVSAVNVLLVSYYLAIFIGGLWASKTGPAQGWLHGLGVGLIFSTVLLVWGLINLSSTLNFQIFLRYLIGILAGIVGGILGVNLKN